jgi:F-type H+-transporting ATPase subunit b
MQFDLFTFLASLLNFGVLLLLLRIFLFKRVTEAMDKREQNIADRWDEAEQAKQEAEEARSEFEEEQNGLDEERQDLIEAAEKQAEEERQQKLEDLQQEIDAKREEWLDVLKADQEKLIRSITEQVTRATADSVDQILGRIADSSLCDRIAITSARRIKHEWSDDLSDIRQDSVTVVSSHALGDDARASLESALKSSVSAGTVDFETDDSLTGGIRIELSDQELELSVSKEVSEMSSRIDSAVAESLGV